MTATSTPLDELIERLRHGTWDAKDAEHLELVSGNELVDELRSSHPVVIQERTIGGKWEVALARSLRPRVLSRAASSALFLTLRIVPVYLDCCFLTIESDRLTGIAYYRKLALLPAKGQASTTEIRVSTTSGHKLAHFPDGWLLKPLRRTTRSLPLEFLANRGWRFPTANQLLPTA